MMLDRMDLSVVLGIEREPNLWTQAQRVSSMRHTDHGNRALLFVDAVLLVTPFSQDRVPGHSPDGRQAAWKTELNKEERWRTFLTAGDILFLSNEPS
jgi:hypothetical protein